MTAAGEVAGATTATAHLQALGDSLRARGLHARVGETSGGLPQLIVLSTAAPSLSEVVFAARSDGSWWFWWSWAERIAPVEELATAVTRVCGVLTPAGRARE
ncbi:hypothetical protein Skr01_58700 [Sphaerisporangium krabiense]|uniref:Uncharacterized protein n=1 Tax=Sphaerisporangium krabiense TaxID=763782 RepID=A0A7W9DSQ3_9ACTN|nr:hypothetical protein [Sphaerisporangium krabiense]MBB5629364.1 hypothetical protein [Sphaerisporangium krabiense]GII65785.1 hypothetical protein Skr01_58700 [Sphaerisporangium krabiense]